MLLLAQKCVKLQTQIQTKIPELKLRTRIAHGPTFVAVPRAPAGPAWLILSNNLMPALRSPTLIEFSTTASTPSRWAWANWPPRCFLPSIAMPTLGNFHSAHDARHPNSAIYTSKFGERKWTYLGKGYIVI
jgi:hypothetical protein